LILKRVCRVPVAIPAIAPATNAAAEAIIGCTCATISTATTAPPSVIDPSAVMSGKEKIRKLMKTPSASSDRMSPMVSAPINRSMRPSLYNADFTSTSRGTPVPPAAARAGLETCENRAAHGVRLQPDRDMSA